jgi:predicted transposase/invertase (TIGR01784 family)
MEMFRGKEAGDLFPEYYVLKVNDFDKTARTPLDEWISFLKTGEIDDHYTAQGLPEARKKLRIDSLSDAERRRYYWEMENRMAENDVMRSAYIDGVADGKEQAREEWRAEGILSVARNLKSSGIPVDVIVRSTGLTVDEINKL